MASPAGRTLAGIDFTSRPGRRKPIVVALGRAEPSRRARDGGAGLRAGSGGAAAADSVRDDAGAIPGRGNGAVPDVATVLRVDRFEAHADFSSFERWLATPGPWLGVFDLPFGLPRELVEALGWPCDWAALIRHYAALDRAEIRSTFAAFCAGRPVGAKFAHRAADGPAGSSPSMKWVNPPVAFMLHAGVPRLLDAGVDLPGLHAGDPARIAIEGYPGMLARELIGRRSYKNDTVALQTVERAVAREALVSALEDGAGRLGVRVALDASQRRSLVDDASGDRVDAVLCLVQAAWAAGQPDHGRPADADPLEGWIVAAPPAGPAREERRR